jgi:hypothetical protein
MSELVDEYVRRKRNERTKKYYAKNKHIISKKRKEKYKSGVVVTEVPDPNIKKMVLEEKRKIDSGEHGSLLLDKIDSYIKKYNIKV